MPCTLLKTIAQEVMSECLRSTPETRYKARRAALSLPDGQVQHIHKSSVILSYTASGV